LIGGAGWRRRDDGYISCARLGMEPETTVVARVKKSLLAESVLQTDG
jgi:hypothetical protein